MESGGHVPANLPRFLKNVDFPATRDDLLAQATQNGADQGFLEVLGKMPQRDYKSIAEVMQFYRESH